MGQQNCAKPCRPFATGVRKSWRSLTDLATRLSNGFVEGKNNRTKAIMRQGYGSRTRRNLRLRILLEVA
jgi:transposase